MRNKDWNKIYLNFFLNFGLVFNAVFEHQQSLVHCIVLDLVGVEYPVLHLCVQVFRLRPQLAQHLVGRWLYHHHFISEILLLNILNPLHVFFLFRGFSFYFFGFLALFESRFFLVLFDLLACLFIFVFGYDFLLVMVDSQSVMNYFVDFGELFLLFDRQ